MSSSSFAEALNCSAIMKHKKFAEEYLSEDRRVFEALEDLLLRMHSIKTWKDYHEAAQFIKTEMKRKKQLKMSTLFSLMGNVVMRAHSKLSEFRIELSELEFSDFKSLTDLAKTTLQDGQVQVQSRVEASQQDLDEAERFNLQHEVQDFRAQMKLVQSVSAQAVRYQLLFQSAFEYLDYLEKNFTRIHSQMNDHLFEVTLYEKDELYQFLLRFYESMGLIN